MNANIADMALSSDYRIKLDQFNIPFRHSAYYLQIGDIQGTQGWLLHISVVRSQIDELLNLLLPVFISEGIPFKIPQDHQTARDILDGCLGSHLLGKVITLYPESIAKALALTRVCIPLTERFEGPDILTDAHLGGRIYARFGAFNPIVKKSDDGKEVNYIFNSDRDEVPDLYHIPFKLPNGITWPFRPLAIPKFDQSKQLLHNKYRVTEVLKSDVKGSVFKALRHSSLFRISWCVIKEAKRSMWSDDLGRDMAQRLQWQMKLYYKFTDQLRLPKIYDLFTENGNTYLSMEYIKGPALINQIMILNQNAVAWPSLESGVQHRILNYLLQVLSIVRVFHDMQCVHRDATPANFIVGKNDQLYPIDIEISYSIRDQKPFPAFEGGTVGFMPPEQEANQTPTLKEDIYALGMTMISLFTSFLPSAIDRTHGDPLRSRLQFLLQDGPVSNLIYECLSPDPQQRPGIKTLQEVISGCQGRLQRKELPTWNDSPPDTFCVKDIIQRAITGLGMLPTAIHDGLWFSASRAITPRQDAQQYEYEKSIGMAEGMAGILYVLSKAKGMGFQIDTCQGMYQKAWGYIFDQDRSLPSGIPAGLYGGGAGLALSLYAALRSCLLDNNTCHRDLMSRWLSISTSSPTMAFGLAGQGVGLLRCQRYMDPAIFREKLSSTVRQLIDHRNKDGHWVSSSIDNKNYRPAIHFSHGNSGILWFILEYTRQFCDKQIQKLALDSLRKLYNQIPLILKELQQIGVRSLLQNNQQIGEGYNGLILTSLKAYEVTRNPFYFGHAEELLQAYPDRLIHNNFTQDSGLAAVGELYLEAHRLSGRELWQRRTDWIVQLLINASHQPGKKRHFWLSNSQVRPTADFMTGTSGIIQFLMRYADPENNGYRLLTE